MKSVLKILMDNSVVQDFQGAEADAIFKSIDSAGVRNAEWSHCCVDGVEYIFVTNKICAIKYKKGDLS